MLTGALTLLALAMYAERGGRFARLLAGRHQEREKGR